MKPWFFTIGFVILLGGIFAVSNFDPVVIYPSGSKVQVPVEIAGVQKKIFAVVTIALGAGIIGVGFCTKKILTFEHPESEK